VPFAKLQAQLIKKSGLLEKQLLSSQSEQFKKHLKRSDCLKKSRSSEKSISFFDM